MKNRIIILIVSFFLVVTIGTIYYVKNYKIQTPKNMPQEKLTRLSAVSGSFYPNEKEKLLWTLSEFFDKAKKENIDSIKAIIAPHAGYVYSGQIASSAFKQIEDYHNITKVIVIGPAHHKYTNYLSLSRADFWETPLGKIELDKNIVSQLETFDEFEYDDEALSEEHSIEVEIPFLQNILKSNWKLIPILTGQVDEETIKSATEKINSIIDENTLIVISSDLSHYYKKEEAKILDQKCIDSINNLKFDSECEACGEIGMKILFELANINNLKPKIISYGDSGDITGDNSSVVGYVSAIFTKDENKNITYSKEERYTLLNLARETIKYAFENEGKYLEINESNFSKELIQKRGAFVTLYKDKKLRGCIGYIEPVEKLYKAIQINSLAAAFGDNRFQPLSKDELNEIEIEISILSIPEETNFENIKIGDGVIIRSGNDGATYLPQVWDDIRDKDEFFKSLCQKAGLDTSCYKDTNTKFYKYSAEVFGEAN